MAANRVHSRQVDWGQTGPFIAEISSFPPFLASRLWVRKLGQMWRLHSALSGIGHTMPSVYMLFCILLFTSSTLAQNKRTVLKDDVKGEAAFKDLMRLTALASQRKVNKSLSDTFNGEGPLPTGKRKPTIFDVDVGLAAATPAQFPRLQDITSGLTPHLKNLLNTPDEDEKSSPPTKDANAPKKSTRPKKPRPFQAHPGRFGGKSVCAVCNPGERYSITFMVVSTLMVYPY